MKKLLAVVMCMVLVFSLGACGTEEKSPEQPVAVKPAEESAAPIEESEPVIQIDEDRPVRVGFSQLGAESDWRVASTKSIKAACEEAGFDLVFSDAQQKQENQIKALKSFITQEVDVIAFSPVVESGWDEVLEEIKDAGIPLILVDRATDNPDDSYWETFMGSDFTLEGNKAGEWLVSYLEENGRADEQINVVELQGTVGSAPANDRKSGFEASIMANPNITITKSQTGDFTRTLGKEVMESFLKSGDKIDVLYAHNDDMGLGAIQAIKDAGLKPGEDIIIIGVDAVKGAFEAMAAGEMNVTVECNPLLGPQLVDAINALMNGEELPKWIPTIEGVYTMDQAAAELPNRQY